MTADGMKRDRKLIRIVTLTALACSAGTLIAATNSTESVASVPGSSADRPLPQVMPKAADDAREQSWNWHVQNTDILQWALAFPAQYSGPNSFNNNGEVAETVSLDLYAWVRLWRGAEAHVDLLV
jgi:hypothetical protein